MHAPAMHTVSRQQRGAPRRDVWAGPVGSSAAVVLVNGNSACAHAHRGPHDVAPPSAVGGR